MLTSNFSTSVLRITTCLVLLLTQATYARGGELDLSFNASTNGLVDEMVVQSDGKILLAGIFTMVNGQTRNRIARLTANGELDADFATVNVNNGVFAMVVQGDGKILLGGNFTMVNGESRNRLARLNVDGSLDMMFNPNVTGDVFTSVAALALQGVEHILVAGDFAAVGTVAVNNMARLNLRGEVDTSFVASTNNSVFAMALDASNNIFIGGFFTQVNGVETAIARLDPDGNVDMSFNSPRISDNNALLNVVAFAVQADGKLVVGGAFSITGVETVNGLMRLNSNGSLDTSFAPPNSIGEREISALALQSNGQILFGGDFANVGAVAMTAHLARLNSDGSLDASFTPGVVVSFNVQAITLQGSDDNILIGGQFSRVGAMARDNIARLVSNNEICLPIIPRNGKTAVVCL